MEHKGTIPLETEQLLLRRFDVNDDIATYKNWASDEAVTEFLTWEPHSSVDVTKDIILRWVKEYDKLDYYNWVIELKETHEIVGSISVVELNNQVESATIGYCMGKSWWGKGIMPEALRCVIIYLIREVGLNRVCANHDLNNPKSGRVMDKAGMKLEGVLRAAGYNKNTGVHDVVWHSILKSEL